MRIERLSAAEARAEVPALGRILLECVQEGASVGFLASITAERAEEFWQEVAAQVERGARGSCSRPATWRQANWPELCR